MDLYARVKELNDRVTQGELDLLEIREQLRRILGNRELSDVQLANAIKPAEEEVTPDAIPTAKRRR